MSLLPPYYNRELFSKHFLEQLLPQRAEWGAARSRADVAATMLRELRSTVSPSAVLKEQQLEQKWIRPVLEVLGVAFDVQPALPTDNAAVTLAPDYAVFGDPHAITAAQALQKKGDALRYFDHVRMVGDAKRWGANFGSASGGQKTPRQQLTDYLHLTGVDWGFLTDGRKWRLVHRSVAGRLDQYYEVDLVECLDSPNADHFLYFYLFFGADAVRAGAAGAACFLDTALRESKDYAEAVGRGLKESVYDALRLLASGYLARADVLSVPPVPTLHAECLTLLYRLLFLLYAEHRRLLPLDDPRYGETYSLSRLTHDLATQLDQQMSLSPRGAQVWGRLASLFEMVDHGEADLGIPAYNGGLFAAGEHPLLAAGGPGDRDLAAAIDLLARTPLPARHFIDYRDLDIRHLGSIYEGLLEYRLAVADADLVIEKEGKRAVERYVPFDPDRHADLPATARVAKGTLYLQTDRGERHVTGSFYTPDFIVDYIVEETLGPLVQGRSPEEITALRVVDPAMGSGHFLLGAVDYLARAYGQARIESGEDADGILDDDELDAYRRIVAEHCVFGVDINPMAVELAKLALWLKTMARDRPLTFLDHQLRCGNSLLGVTVAQLDDPPPAQKRKKRAELPKDRAKQISLFSQIFASRLPLMVDSIAQILARDTRTRDDIAVKRACDKAVEDTRRPFTAVADTWLATLSGATPRDFDGALSLLHTPGKLFEHPDVVAARDIATAKHFFHWEMEFPEVFFDRGGSRRRDAGFDAVIGNPPWVRQESIANDKDALATLYAEVFDGVADTYVYFVARGVSLLRSDGRLGMILPNKWMRADYGFAMRELLIRGASPTAMVDFGHSPVFPDADTFPCILVASTSDRANASMRYTSVARADLPGIDLSRHARRRGFDVDRFQLRPEGWSPTPPDVAALLDRIRRAGRPLKELFGSPLYGLKTGLNDAFLIDGESRRELIARDPSCAEVIRKYLRGSDISRWAPRWDDQWMIAIASSENHSWPWAESSPREAEARFPRPTLRCTPT